jgi:hypothetical protein
MLHHKKGMRTLEQKLAILSQERLQRHEFKNNMDKG